MYIMGVVRCFTLNYFVACLLIIASYLLGSIPFGLIVGKLKGIDIRNSGSGNIGSTNAIRVLGKKWGFLASTFDVLKGAIIIVIIYILEGCNIWYNPFIINGESLYIIYGIAAVIGHSFSIFLKFKGGKAVATSLGVITAVFPWCSLIILVVFSLTVALTKYVSLGSTFSTIATVLGAYLIYGLCYAKWISATFTLIMALIILIKHIPNYKRLIKHNENKIGQKKAS